MAEATREGLIPQPRSRLLRRKARVQEGSRPPRMRGDRTRSFLVTLIAVTAIAAFLSPMLRAVTVALKSTEQITQTDGPLLPSDPVTYTYQGKELPLLVVPLADGTTKTLALFEPGRKASTFIDPEHPEAAPIQWVGSWRVLDHIWALNPHFESFGRVWDLIHYPRLLFNTIVIALLGTIGTLISCTLVAYGFAR